MCIKTTHFKCLKSYYRISRVEVTHLFLECKDLMKISKVIFNTKLIYLLIYDENVKINNLQHYNS